MKVVVILLVILLVVLLVLVVVLSLMDVLRQVKIVTAQYFHPLDPSSSHTVGDIFHQQ